MDTFTYKVVYYPELDTGYGAEEKGINFLCSDGKIHIRLRDYDHEEVIHGFIGKLTYLVTYGIKSIESKSLNTKDEVFNSFPSSEFIIKLNCFISSTLHDPKFKGISISKNYRKTKGFDVLGSFSKGTCPLDISNDLTTYGNLQFFLTKLGVGVSNLYTFLFNDAFELVISKECNRDSYKKFVSKAARKEKRVKESSKKELSYVSLFDF